MHQCLHFSVTFVDISFIQETVYTYAARGVSRIFQKGFPSIDNQWVRLYGMLIRLSMRSMLHLGGSGGMPPQENFENWLSDY